MCFLCCPAYSTDGRAHLLGDGSQHTPGRASNDFGQELDDHGDRINAPDGKIIKCYCDFGNYETLVLGSVVYITDIFARI